MKSERIKQLKCSINFGELNISDYDYERVFHGYLSTNLKPNQQN